MFKLDSQIQDITLISLWFSAAAEDDDEDDGDDAHDMIYCPHFFV